MILLHRTVLSSVLVLGAAHFGCSNAPGETDQARESGGSASGGGPNSSGGADTSPGEASWGAVDDPFGGQGRGTPPDPASITCRVEGDEKTTLTFVNGCARNLTFRGSDINGGDLAPGAFTCVDIGSDVEPLSSKRYWGFLGEDPGGEHHTLAEFTFNTDFYDFDWYNISHVDAHNLPVQIVPVLRPDCEVLTCAESWLRSCPTEGLFEDSAGTVVACVSPDRDNPTSPVAEFFEVCDEAYAWSGDDQNGEDPSPMRACAGEDWDIVFCPEAER